MRDLVDRSVVIYPYRLKGLTVEHSDHVWCADIACIPVQRGFLYLVAVMDRAPHDASCACLAIVEHHKHT